MNKVDYTSTILKTLLYLSGIGLVLYIVSQVKVVIAYIIIASILSLIFRPVFDFINEKLKLPIDWESKIFVPYNYGYFAFVYNNKKIKIHLTQWKS